MPGDLLREGVGGLRLGLLDDLRLVEGAQDVLVGRERLVQCAQQRDRGELARLVDADGEDVLLADGSASMVEKAESFMHRYPQRD